MNEDAHSFQDEDFDILPPDVPFSDPRPIWVQVASEQGIDLERLLERA